MTGIPLDEQTAWEVVRATPRIDAASRDPVTVVLGDRSGVAVHVWGSGRWETACVPTPAAADLLDLYLPVQVPERLALAQMGQSLDGRIATESGDSHFVTGPADILRLHRVRSLVDAVVVGAGTVAGDNPRLTVREVAGRNPVRVVLDPDGRLQPDRHVFTDGAARTLVVRRATSPASGPSLRGDVLFLPTGGAGGFDPHVVLSELGALGLRRVLVEGGGLTVSRFLQAGALDRMHVTVAPLLIGSGRPSVTLTPIESLGQALRPRCRHFRLGNDVLFDLDLRQEG